MAAVLRQCLEQEELIPTVAADGAAGINLALEGRFDAIVLDVMLPLLDGFEVARRLREHEAFKAVPLIAMTGYGHETDKQQSKDAGFNFHLVKPIDPERLQDLLASLATPST